MRMCVFEQRAANLEPLSWTRPVFDLLCGQTSLGHKQLRHFTPKTVGALVRPYLEELCRLRHPSWAVNGLGWLRSGPTLLINGRWLPPAGKARDLGAQTCVGLCGDEVAYVLANPEHLHECGPLSLDECLEKWKVAFKRHDAGGQLVNHPWDLVQHNAEQLEMDFTFWGPRQGSADQPAISVVGPPERLHVEPSAQLDPYVVADTRQGPIIIDHKAVVTAFTRLEGPCYIGPGTHVLAAKIRGGTTLGPQCRIGGEVEASIVHGCSNKYHDGFLGHAYVGEWVNLGAGTHNSDLRNDYGPVNVTVNGQSVATGQTKVGCFLGDHTKTGLGTLINTGTNAGIFCNLLPAGPLAPKYLPSFTTWWNGELRESLDWWHLLDTARQVMQRRGLELTDIHSGVYRHVFEETVNERRRTLREMEQRRLRRSA